ncbi:MAG TPA: fibronectin type III domain-containing protein [Thermoanaerobaculia bacterium]|nr:fibronectin type III domain-containing protein [Thermoanaerobaculia bacterium]
MRLARVLAVLSLTAVALSAQPLSFGTPFALTNTRYQPAGGSTLLRSNGSEAFVFWADSRLRMSRVGKGETRVGRELFDMRVDDRGDFDAVWTGSHFLVVAMESGTYQIFGRIVSASGEPQGEPFPITNGLWPRMAFNGRVVLLLTNERAYVLNTDGMPVSEPQIVEQRFFTGPAYVVAAGDRFAAILPTGYEQLLSIFDTDGRQLSKTHIAEPFTRTALASDGSRVLVVNADGANLSATLIQPDGTFGSSTLLETAPGTFFFDPQAAWIGTRARWVIAYRDSGNTRIAEVDPSGQFIVARQTIASAQEPVLVAVGSRVTAAWLGNNGSIFSDELPIDGGATAAHEAISQQLFATAVSANATLVVWGGDGVHVGIRTHDGRWREYELGVVGGYAAAASDGREFVVIVGDTAFRLDADGQVKPGGTTRITEFVPNDIAWNGSMYAVIGDKNGAPIAALLSPAGTLFPAIGLPYSATYSLIASDGNGFFAVWLTPQSCSPLAEFCPPGGIAGIHLDANLLPVEASPIVLEPSSTGGVFSADVTWNGTDYVAAWASTARGIVAARIGKPEQFILAKTYGTSVSVAPLPGGAAVGWSLFNRSSNIPHESAVALLGAHDEISYAALIHRGPEFVRLSLATLPAGELAVSYSSVQDGAPHYGAARVMMRIAAPVLPPRPDAPRATLRKNGGEATIEWTRPPQPVGGYRVEYRVEDGAWTEVERWFDPEERQFSMAGNVALRVRAFNDAGASDYALAIPNTNRGRAARH